MLAQGLSALAFVKADLGRCRDLRTTNRQFMTAHLAMPPPCLSIGSIETVPPAILEQVPFGTSIHFEDSRSCFDVPLHELVAVPQSFLPAAAIPAHFSMSAAFALTLAARDPTARSAVTALNTTARLSRCFNLLLHLKVNRSFLHLNSEPSSPESAWLRATAPTMPRGRSHKRSTRSPSGDTLALCAARDSS
jgi:hypothetical protein